MAEWQSVEKRSRFGLFTPPTGQNAPGGGVIRTLTLLRTKDEHLNCSASSNSYI